MRTDGWRSDRVFPWALALLLGCASAQTAADRAEPDELEQIPDLVLEAEPSVSGDEPTSEQGATAEEEATSAAEPLSDLEPLASPGTTPEPEATTGSVREPEAEPEPKAEPEPEPEPMVGADVPFLYSDRPTAQTVNARREGSVFVLDVRYDQPPWGQACKRRCARTTLYLDLDGESRTGLQGGEPALLGADLAIVLRGMRTYRERSADTYLEAELVTLGPGDRSARDGVTIRTLHHRKDEAALQTSGREVQLRLDTMTLPPLPQGRTARLVHEGPDGRWKVQRFRGM